MTASLVETTRKRQLESKEAPGLSRRSSYVSHIRLENIRGFGPKFDLNLSSEEDGNARRRTLIIGQNGTCKTTLLRCIALSMCWREDANALLAEQIGPIIAQDCEEGAIEVHLQRGRTKSVIRNRVARTRDRRDHFIGAGRERNVRAKFPFICAVGAGRSGEGADPYRSYQVVDSVYSLFNYESTLTSVELCLHRLRNFRIRGKLVYRPIMNCIKSALKLPPGARFELGDAGGVFISGSGLGRRIPLQAWADGYMLTTSWILDVYSWAMRARAIIENGGIDGIILVDEIEQHIHPSMQMGLLGVLSTFWPAAQIFATTHSPLTALGAQPEELVVLKRSSSGIELVKDPPDFTGYSVLEMLTDNRLFGSPGFRPEVKAQIEAYSSLSAKPKAERTKAESKELLQVSRKLMDAELSKPAHTPLLRQLNELLARHNL